MCVCVCVCVCRVCVCVCVCVCVSVCARKLITQKPPNVGKRMGKSKKDKKRKRVGEAEPDDRQTELDSFFDHGDDIFVRDRQPS